MEIEIRPADGFSVEVNGEMVIGEEDAISLMENGKNEGYGVKVTLRAYGFTMNSNVERAALRLAGLSGLAAAKATASGRIEF